MDIIIPSLCVRYGNIQSRGQLFNYLSNPRIHPVCQRIRIQRQPTIRTHLAAIIPSNPSKIISAKHHTVTYKSFPLFEFPCSQHVIIQRTFQFPDFIPVYSSSISGPRTSPKPCPSTSRTTNTLRWKPLQDNWTTSSLSSTTPSYIIIMDMCRSWANESLQKINDTGVIIKKYMLSSTITVLLWWYMGSWFLRSVRCSRRAQLTIIVSGGSKTRYGGWWRTLDINRALEDTTFTVMKEYARMMRIVIYRYPMKQHHGQWSKWRDWKAVTEISAFIHSWLKNRHLPVSKPQPRENSFTMHLMMSSWRQQKFLSGGCMYTLTQYRSSMPIIVIFRHCSNHSAVIFDIQYLASTNLDLDHATVESVFNASTCQL